MTKEKPRQKTSETDLNGAAIIDENGAEVPITEDMIKTVLEQLETGDSQPPKRAS